MGSAWGISATFLDAMIKIFTVPLLIGFYGKSDFGLIALAFSLNAYLRLSELGMNTGSIRFFSQWMEQKKTAKIVGLSQSSMIFYGGVGLVNGLILLLLCSFGGGVFHLSPEQNELFFWLCLILAFSAIFYWISFVFIQLLTAHEDFRCLKQAEIIRSILNLCSVAAAVYFEWSLPVYFAVFSVTNLSTLPINMIRLRRIPIPFSSLIRPAWHPGLFREVLVYGLSVFSLTLFQYSANYLRPVLLGIFDPNGVDSIANFRVLQSITQLIIAVGSVFMGILLPITAKKYALQQTEKNKILIHEGTKYVTVFLSYIVSLIVLNAKEILTVYVGASFSHLSGWLQLWSLTILLYLHNTPVASLVLASGKIKQLVLSSAAATAISLAFLAFTASALKVGSAVFGFLIYITIQMMFYYIYYNHKIFKLDSVKLFGHSFFRPATLTMAPAVLALIVSHYWHLPSALGNMAVKTGVFHAGYIPILLLWIIRPDEINALARKIGR